MIERYSLPAMSHVWSVENKTDQWLAVEIAACEAWAELGRIPRNVIPKIQKATYNLDRMREIEAETHHDIIAFTRSVGESLGEERRYIHFGLTSTDVVDTAQGVQFKEAGDLLARDVRDLIAVLERRAMEHKDTICIGRTHGIHAEPTTFGFKLAIWVDEMRRNLKRLEAAKGDVAVGKISGAVGTHANIPPEVEEFVCNKLGIAVVPVSSQILQRDRHAAFVSTLAVIASSLDKMATEIRHLQRTEVREVEEPFEEGRQQGSSAMPHKRNPELSERVCGLARVVRGYSVTAMEDVALWHERDISHSSAERVIFPDACLALDYILHLFTYIMDGLRVFSQRMLRNLESTGGLIYSQRVLLALIDKGMDRQAAYKIVQRSAMRAWEGDERFIDLLRADPEVAKSFTPDELTALFDHKYHLQYIDTAFKRLGLELSPR